MMSVSSLYIHIPFCLKRCLYCDFYSIPFNPSLSEDYIEALLLEIEARMPGLDRLKTVYIGGGTPTALSIYSLDRLISKLYDIPWSDDIEITIEANPCTVDREKIRILRDLGVNRFSLGIQSFIDKELQILGRIHNSSGGIDAIEILRDEGIENLSIDLIYGIPGQSIEDWGYNLSMAMRFSPEHISTYELTLEEGTPLYSLVSEGILKKPGEDTIVGMYYDAVKGLTVAGYRHYEISNFSREGLECRHNINYWERGRYTGLGAGAHSFEGEVRRENIRDVVKYIATLKRGELPSEREMEITREEALKEYIFLGLRKRDGLSKGFFEENFGIDISLIAGDILEDGLLEMIDGHIRLTEKGITVSNSIIVRLFELLGL
jgi:oxygen-independent coproporphyrinogen-3 oxidase